MARNPTLFDGIRRRDHGMESVRANGRVVAVYRGAEA